MTTPEAILQSKEDRAVRQTKWIENYRNTLISFTLNIPGICKQSENYEFAHEVGTKIIMKTFPVIKVKKIHLPTGSEALFSIPYDAKKTKKISLKIEELHPLGRLFDIDVISKNGKKISRINFGYHERKCYLCEDKAAFCARSQKHSLEQLTDRIETIISEYKTNPNDSVDTILSEAQIQVPPKISSLWPAINNYSGSPYKTNDSAITQTHIIQRIVKDAI